VSEGRQWIDKYHPKHREAGEKGAAKAAAKVAVPKAH